METYLFSAWTEATANLNAGVQRVLHDTLNLVKDGKVHLVHSSDYSQGYPCLINSVAQMTEAGGGAGVPSDKFPTLVSLFDRINQFMRRPGYNNSDDNFVSPAVAEVLLHYFAPLKEISVEKQVNDATKNAAFAEGIPYREPKDEDLMRDWINAMQAEPRNEIHNEQPVLIQPPQQVARSAD